MATGSDSDDLSTSSGRRPRSGLEKDDLAGSDDDSRYVFQHHHGGNDARPEIKRRRLELEGIVVDGGAVPSPTPSSECGSGGTISVIDADAGAASLAQKLLAFPCPICGREFGSKQAVSGHMRVHDSHRRQKWRKERTPAISGGCAVTGKRGSVGCRSVSPKSKGVVDSMAMVIPEPVIDPMPIAFASRAGAAARSPSLPMTTPWSSLSHHQTILPARSSCTHHVRRNSSKGTSPPHLRSSSPKVHNLQRRRRRNPSSTSQLRLRSYSAHRRCHQHGTGKVGCACREKGCDHRRFATYQGLGKRMACHKIRQRNNEAAAAGHHLGVGDPSCAKPAKLHPCKNCPRVFTSGYQLGGHMRKHSEKVIPKKHGARPKVSAHELTSALAPSLPMPPAAMEVAPAQPAVAPGVPGVLRLFGVNIVPAGPPASAAEEVSPAETGTDESSTSSTDIEQ